MMLKRSGFLDSVQKLEIEARDKKIAALEEEIRKLREGALRNDPAVAMKKIPRHATADFLANSCGQIATSRKIHNFPQSACTSRYPFLLTC